MPTEKDFQDLRRFGDELEPELKASFYRMIGASESYADTFAGTPDLLKLINTGNSGALRLYAERLVSRGLIPNSLDFMNVMFLIMFRSGVGTVVAETSLTLPLLDSTIDAIRTHAMERGQQFGGQWVTNISQDTARGMRDIMLDAMKRGVGPTQLGRELRSSIGLLPQHQIAWQNYNVLLEEKVGLGDTYERLSQMYHRRLLAWRANVIARTETMYAVHEGQRIAWNELRKVGVIQDSRTWITWVTVEDDRLCDRCAPMDGRRIRFGDKFVFRYDERGFPDGKPDFVDSPYDRRRAIRPGKPGDRSLKPRIPIKKIDIPAKDTDDGVRRIEVEHPPLHPNCRCTLVLQFD